MMTMDEATIQALKLILEDTILRAPYLHEGVIWVSTVCEDGSLYEYPETVFVDAKNGLEQAIEERRLECLAPAHRQGWTARPGEFKRVYSDRRIDEMKAVLALLDDE